MADKYSYVTALEAVLNGANVDEDTDLNAKLVQLKTSLANRKSNGGKTKAEIEEDAKTLEAVYNALTETPATATTIAHAIDAEWTSQKVSPRLKALVREGKAVAYKALKEPVALTAEEFEGYNGAKLFARA